MPNIYDNIEKHLATGLENTLDVSQKADFCIGYFNLRGWKQVANKIEKWQGTVENRCRVLVGMQKAPREIIQEHFSNIQQGIVDNKKASKLKKQLAREFREQLTIGVPTEQDEKGLRKLSKQLKQGKVIVKLFLKHSLHAKLYLCYREDKINPIIGHLGSSNLTFAGLQKQGELNVDVLEQDAAKKLVEWFNNRWENRWCIDISEELAEIIDESWATEKLRKPYHIYLKIAYHLSQEARAGLTEFNIPKVFQNILAEFQQKAVLVAAHHLNKRNGVLIGDVVGLGKTIVATALAKIFEDDFFLETLIICPKNLTEMWKDYVHEYRLRAKVLSITKVQRELPEERRYRIVIIDESQRLRNREGKRYRAIQEYIQLNDSKVILLSATPYNKTFLDLSNQLRLFISEDDELGIRPERYIEKVGGEVQFKARHQYDVRTLPAFEQSDYIDDWRELMRLFLVRRTRSFIKKHYAYEDPNNGRKYIVFPNTDKKHYFPERIPKVIEFNFDPDDPNDQYARLYDDKIVDSINSLNLPRYGLGNYIDKNSKLTPSKKEEQIIENLSRAGKRLMGFCRTNLFKRLESSGHAFLLSLSRHALRNYIYVYALKNNLEIPIGAQEANLLDDFLDDEDLEKSTDVEEAIIADEQSYLKQAGVIYKQLSTKLKNRFQWIRSGLFKKSLISNLEHDCKIILRILRENKKWDPKQDRQVKALYKLCTENHPKDKVLIFTQYSDTAYYLFNVLEKRGIEKLDIATGDIDNPTDIAHRFSPKSNSKPKYKDSEQEIRVLISTDVLSEGQNLQDAHLIVNYDLPWAIIRLIQRAGRVDRIGQQSTEIICYSFLPEDGIDRIINLRGRLRTRIEENAEVVGSDETFFEDDSVNLQDLYSEKSKLLEEDEAEEEIDLSSYAYQIWKDATDKDPDLKKLVPDMPEVVYATKQLSGDMSQDKEGAIVYTRTTRGNDVLTWVGKNGKVISQSQFAILKAIACKPDEAPQHKLKNHHQLVQKSLDYVKDVEDEVGGQLGKRSSAKYRTYMRLDRYYKENKNTLFATERLKNAIDDIYRFPLKAFAREALNRQLKAGINDEDLVNLVVSLREEDKLCIVSEEEEKTRIPKIICSMGLTQKSK